MRPTYLAVLAGLVAVPACKRAEEPKQASLAAAMPNLPLPPKAEFVSRSGSADALQFVFQSTLRRDDVAAYLPRITIAGAPMLRVRLSVTRGRALVAAS